MANLQKVIKVTQAQYDILAAGGTVGSYTGLDDNYVYLVEDTNEYITSAGGEIDGSLTITAESGGIPLTINYNNDSDYFLKLFPNPNDNSNFYTIDVEDSESGEITLSLPANSGTIALTNDIINVVANPQTTTATLSGITIGNTSYSIQGGVTDVQINGTSILSNTIANFVTKKAYNASTNKIVTESDLPQVFNYLSTPQPGGPAA